MILKWDQIGDRRFETGINRGVLYLRSGGVVPWNGLVSITEDRDQEVKSYYMDGVKYLDHYVPGSYSATLQAFTYPEELDKLTGVGEFAPGVFVHDQRAEVFHLSYRTRVGNDLEGVDYSYKIHVLYNVLATPSSVSMETVGETLTPKPFQWKLTGTPNNMFGIRPTSHISLDARLMIPDRLIEVEELLYGRDPDPTNPDDEGMWPVLPSAIELLAMLEESGGTPT